MVFNKQCELLHGFSYSLNVIQTGLVVKKVPRRAIVKKEVKAEVAAKKWL